MAFLALTSQQRGLLSQAVTTARREAEEGAREALEALAVNHHEPFGHMTIDQRALRNALRDHGRQLGDARDSKRGTQAIDRLAHEVAFEHWHRMLFARFLAENGLLIHSDHGVAVSIEDCIDLATEQGQDPWALAASFAQDMLPRIFRKEDPALSVALAINRRTQIEKLLADLPADIFLATDALGWTYQFWQSEKKAEVNARGEAVGADDISAVTQFFTEHYMVEFLLHNTLGAWHAGKVLAANPRLAETATSEVELRKAVAVDGCDWKYLRFVRDDARETHAGGLDKEPIGPWIVASGTYPSWPQAAKEITVLEPCLGSGHIFVTALELMVALRRHEEGLDLKTAIRKVLTENMFGLELDPRCTQIGAFAVALHAWRMLGERCDLPKVQIAACGLSVGGTKDAWLKHAAGDMQLSNGMSALYDLFEQAPLLGSLIDPDRMLQGTLLTAGFDEIAPLVEQALASSSDGATHEAGIAAAGMVEAVRLLRRKYTLVVTNPPYLGRGKQSEQMTAYADEYEKDAKQDLATMFVSRALRWCDATGSIAMVLPQNWLFLTSYKKLRERLLKEQRWNLVARLGSNAFQDMNWWAATTTLLVVSGGKALSDHRIAGIDVSSDKRQTVKAALLRGDQLLTPQAAPTDVEALPVDGEEVGFGTETRTANGTVSLESQAEQLKHPDARITFSTSAGTALLNRLAAGLAGIQTGDYPRFALGFWEIESVGDGFEFFQTTARGTSDFDGCSLIVRWTTDGVSLDQLAGVYVRGKEAWGRQGVAISPTGELGAARYAGVKYDNSTSVIVSSDPTHLPAVWAFCASPEFAPAVRRIDQALKVTNASLVKIPFDLAHWERIAGEKYPKGLPEPQSGDPTQWLFHGHPGGMLAASPTSASPFGIADRVGANRHPSLVCRTPNVADVLQVAVARLVGYRWPAELNTTMEMDEAARDWATRCDALLTHSDADGIVPVNSMRGEPPAEERVIALLRDALTDAGAAFDQSIVAKLIAVTGSKATSLTEWLLNDFFEHHCTLFQDRPFVWHIWDGRKDGFNVLVNYHRLASDGDGGRQTLEKLTYAYLKDWIDRQEAGVREGAAAAEARLAAATTLQKELKKILEGEAPHDVFVRWKSLSQQPIGWTPDIKDGVRVNIRPFLLAKDVGRKGAGILRAKCNIKWTKDRGNEPQSLRLKADYPWFWSCEPGAIVAHRTDFMGGREFTGERWNDLHYTLAAKQAARAKKGVSKK
jgi:hypothetical protein